MASNPGWVTGFIPTATQWNEEFGGKADYPVPITQGGSGAITAAAANYNLQQRALVGVADSPVALVPLTFYGLRTATGAITVNLPQLVTLNNGDWIELADADYNANTNNVTIAAFSGDVIALYDTTAANQTLDQAGARAVLMVNNSAWRMLV